MDIRVLLSSMIGCFIAFAAVGQSPSKLEKKAEKIFYDENFREALPVYNQLLSVDPDNSNAKYRAELCSLLLLDHRDKSLETILGYSETRGRRDKFYNYWLGRIYLARDRPDEAITAWTAFLDLSAYKSQIIIDETREFIEIAKRAKHWFENPVWYEITKLEGVNSDHSELSATLLEDHGQLLYATRDKDHGTLQLFISTQNGESWSAPEQFTLFGKLDNTNLDIDYLDPSRLLLKNGGNKIKVITNENGNWTSPRTYDYQFSGGKAKSHFSISQEEDRIVFAQMGTLGNMDLFEATKTEGKWGKPRFILNTNTPFNEDSPFLSADGKMLYFSSEGHDAIGGFDIMASTLEGDEWSAPQNMGYPMNTLDNELHFSANADGSFGHLSSDRMSSSGGYDVYSFKKITINEIAGAIVHKETNLPLPAMRIEFQPSSFPTERFSATTSQTGGYSTKIMSSGEFTVRIYDSEELVHEDGLRLKKPKDGKRYIRNYKVIPSDRRKTLAQALTTDENAQFDEDGYSEFTFIANKFRPGRKAILKNLYFKFGGTELIDGSDRVLSILVQMMQDHPELQIEIGGHTDNLGDHQFNQWLSTQRAKAIYSHLVDNGIENSRLLARGYGETKPLASNDDEADGRALNRRIEIMVIE